MSWKQFLGTRSNLGGVAGVGVVGLLWLVGALTDYVPLVAVIAYASGFVLFWSSREVLVPSKLDVMAQVRWLRAKAQPRLDGEARDLLSRILGHIEALLPRLADMRSQGLLEVEQRVALRQTVTHLLPNVLNPYLRLPANFARTRALGNGKTAQEEMTEQLRLLESQVFAIREAAFSRDTEALLLSGRVLEERFRQFDIASKRTP